MTNDDLGALKHELSNTYKVTMSAGTMSGHAGSNGFKSGPRFWSRFPRGGIINPSSMRKALFDFLGMLVLAFDAILVPYVLAWQPAQTPWLMVASWITSTFWSVDLVLCFFTGFYQGGDLQVSLPTICRHYLITWFLPDVLALVSDWGSMVMMLVNSSSDNIAGVKAFRLAKLGRAIRIISFLRVVRKVRMFDELLQRDSSGTLPIVFEVLKLFLGILWLNHLTACVWYWIGTSSSIGTWTDEALSVAERDRNDASYAYFTSLHWSLSQITPGSMEVHPVNTSERQFNVVVLCLGLIFVSSLTSKMSANMVRLQTTHDAKTKHIRTLRSFLHQCNVAPDIAVRIQKHALKRLMQKQRLTLDEVEAMKFVSPMLRATLLRELFVPHLQCHPLLLTSSILSTGVMDKLCSIVQTVWTVAGETLFVPSAQAKQAWLLVAGALQYTQVPESSPVLAETVVAVAESAWICEVAWWCHWTHVGVMESSDACELVSVPAEGFIAALAWHRVVREFSRAYAEQFHERVTSAAPPWADWPTDLRIPFTDFDELVVSMVPSIRTIAGQAALRHIAGKMGGFAAFPVTTLKNFEQLETELHAGKSLTLLTGSGAIERVVLVVVLRIVDNAGKVLVRLGKCGEGGAVQPQFQLPASKPQKDEPLEDAVQRILENELTPLAGCLQLQHVEYQPQQKKSHRVGVPTKYLRMVQHACLDRSSQLPMPETELKVGGKGIRESKQSLSQVFDFVSTGGWNRRSWQHYVEEWSANAFTMHHAKDRPQRYAYVWLTPENEARFSGPLADATLRAQVAAIDHTSLPVLPVQQHNFDGRGVKFGEMLMEEGIMQFGEMPMEEGAIEYAFGECLFQVDASNLDGTSLRWMTC